ncbi:MAG: LLM class flavin-dependent oxidoreductase [Pseudomonadales bacterium]|nr:LLM class flavin-dependent oxidoreductase [Pseudomonadales bacterium]
MTISAGLGIASYPFANPGEFWSWVDLCEDSGVDSLWQSDRIIGADPNLECMSVMAALAGRTRRLKFGMNVASLGLRDPVLMAKACATIDVLSEGRLLPAFGVGSARSRDYSATGTPTRARGQRAAEGLEILTRLWSEESVTFAGTHYRLEDASIAPKPVQKPLPLWVGGSAEAAVQRTARWGTGWQAGIETPAEVAPVIAAIKAALPAHNRQIDEDHFGAGFGFRFGSPDEPAIARYREVLQKRLGKDPDGLMAVGDASDILGLIDAFRGVGVHKFILRPISFSGTDYIAQTRRLIDEVLPEIARLNRR